MATKKTTIESFRLKHVEISNFKAIDKVKLSFPPPRMKADPDVHVMGSRNGLGKTSILEACTLLLLSAHSGAKELNTGKMPGIPVNISELLIRAGAESASVVGEFSLNGSNATISISLSRDGVVKIEGDSEKIKKVLTSPSRVQAEDMTERFLMLLAGYSMDPVITHPCLYFHSYRKVQEGNPELGMMVESDHRRMMIRTPYGMMRVDRGGNMFVGTFKLQILRAMMGKANLFEFLDNENADAILEELNGLIRRYAGGKIDKLRPSPDNTVDFRITPVKGGKSFAFDGLSSGQKEIISTLFLIWHYTRNQPCIVLIDEPELHLNVEWHRDFVQQVFKLAPNNQYIIATHSEDIFKSVDEDRRLFLGVEADDGIGNDTENKQ